MDKAILPDLTPVGKPLGVVSVEAAATTGLPEGLILIAAAADKATEVLGAGCLDPHIGCLSYGSATNWSMTC